MSLCWKNCPEDRQTFKELYCSLHEILHTKAVRNLLITIAMRMTMTSTNDVDVDVDDDDDDDDN